MYKLEYWNLGFFEAGRGSLRFRTTAHFFLSLLAEIPHHALCEYLIFFVEKFYAKLKLWVAAFA